MAPADGLALREEHVRRGSTLPIWLAAAGAVVLVAALSYAVLTREISSTDSSSQASSAPAFVGSETCAGCHRSETELWRNSQHKQAMDHASEKSVLGDFNEASFDYYDVHSRLFRKGGKFFVE